MLFLSAHFARRKFFPERWRIVPLTSGVLAIVLQCGAFTALVNVSRESAELEKLMNALPEKTVVTDVFFLPEQTPHLFFTKTILQIDGRNTAKLAEYLKADRTDGFILILSADPRFRRISNAGLANFLDAAVPVHVISKLLPGKCYLKTNKQRQRSQKKNFPGRENGVYKI